VYRFTRYQPYFAADHVGKSFELSEEGALKSLPPAFPNVLLADIITVDSLKSLHQFLLDHEQEYWCATWGIPKGDGPFLCLPDPARKSGRRSHLLEDVEEPTRSFPIISRTKQCLSYPPGHGILAIDYDPPKGGLEGHPWSHQQVWQALIRVAPEFAKSPRIVLPSSSAFIEREDGTALAGSKGWRILVPVLYPERVAGYAPNPGAYARILKDRMMINGDFWPFIDSAGRIHARGPIDLALIQQAQPDFLGPPKMGAGLIRSRPAIAYIPGEGQKGDIETPFAMAQIEVLTFQERELLRGLDRDMRARSREKSETAREEWLDRGDLDFLRANPQGDVRKARARREALIKRWDGSASQELPLPPDHVIFFDNGLIRTVAQIAADPDAYVGKTTASPIEPGYGGVDGGVGKGKGKIKRQSGRLIITDYAHGAFQNYLIGMSGDDFDRMVLDAGVVGTPDPENSDPETGKGTHDQGADHATPELREAPPPLPAPVILPTPAHRFPQEARASLRRKGITCVSGISFQKEMIRTWIQGSQRLAIAVPDYDAAITARSMVRDISPEAKIQIVPGRSTDPVKRRKANGVDVFEYYDEHGKIQGHEDILCEKLELVRKLHGQGLNTVSPLTCRSVSPAGEESCPHLRECGFVKRARARINAEILIYCTSHLLGQDNPLLSGDTLADLVEGTILIDLDTLPPNHDLAWRIESWERADCLRQILALAKVNEGLRPTAIPGGADELLRRVKEWVGMVPISPRMDATRSMEALEHYVAHAQGRVEKGDPGVLVLQEAVEAWLDGRALIRISDKVRVFIHEPLRRLEGSRALIAASASPRLNLTSSRVSTVSIDASVMKAVAGTLVLPDILAEPETGTVEMPIAMRSSDLLLPSRTIQILSDFPGSWLHKQSFDGASVSGGRGRQQIRDLTHLAKLLHDKHGHGVVVSSSSDRLRSTFEEFGIGDEYQLDFRNYGSLTSTFFLGSGFDPSVRWVMAIGRGDQMAGNMLLRSAVGYPVEMWSRSLPGSDEAAVISRAKPIYHGRTGTLDPPDSGIYRKAGSTPLLDEILESSLAGPLSLACNWLCDQEQIDGMRRMMIVVTTNPLAHGPIGQARGVLVDELKGFDSVPPAAFVLHRLEQMKNREIEDRLGLKARRVRLDLHESRKNGKGDAQIEYWISQMTTNTLLDELDDENAE
jgi:hypothetical protein